MPPDQKPLLALLTLPHVLAPLVGLIKHLRESEVVSRELGCCKNLDSYPCTSHPSCPGPALFAVVATFYPKTLPHYKTA